MKFPITALAVALLASPTLTHAQSYQCRAPSGQLNVPKIGGNNTPRRLPVTGYTLALSWSPEFCKSRKKSRGHAWQCSGRQGRFGMVVHGLWPNANNSWPQWCSARRTLAPAEVRRNMCMMPSARLQARQWVKHGSCMVSQPSRYFKATRILYNSLNWPDFDRLSRERGLNAGQVRDAFIRANPAWRREHIGIKTNRGGWLQELRLCYGKDFMPVRCSRNRLLGPRDKTRVKIWRGL